MKRFVPIFLFLFIFPLVRPGLVFADGVPDKAVSKLGRGLVNVATGWLELPMQLSNGMSEAGGVEGFFLGLGKGAVFTVLREAAGFYDTATFLFPVPSDYAPVMQPPTVFDGS